MLSILLPFKAASNVSISRLAISGSRESVRALEVMRSDFTFRYTRACDYSVRVLLHEVEDAGFSARWLEPTDAGKYCGRAGLSLSSSSIM